MRLLNVTKEIVKAPLMYVLVPAKPWPGGLGPLLNGPAAEKAQCGGNECSFRDRPQVTSAQDNLARLLPASQVWYTGKRTGELRS